MRIAWTAVLLAGAACRPEPAGVERAEAAIELHVRALEARSRGEGAAAHELFEQACRLEHEPSCAEIWLRVELSPGRSHAREPASAGRAAVEDRARRVAEATGGCWFLHEQGGTPVARVYCPLAREPELEAALAALADDDGASAQPDDDGASAHADDAGR